MDQGAPENHLVLPHLEPLWHRQDLNVQVVLQDHVYPVLPEDPAPLCPQPAEQNKIKKLKIASFRANPTWWETPWKSELSSRSSAVVGVALLITHLECDWFCKYFYVMVFTTIVELNERIDPIICSCFIGIKIITLSDTITNNHSLPFLWGL